QYVEYECALGSGRHFLEVRWDLGKEFYEGEKYSLDPVFFEEGYCNGLLADYAEKLKKKAKISFRDTMRTGWCSWYYYYTRIDADCILSNLECSCKNKIPFDFFQIDDGYQRAVGDWLTLTPGFEGRMKEVTDAIRSAGYTPGLWIAPFITTDKAPSFYQPGWVLRDEKGKPVVAGWNPNWGGVGHLPFYALDVTHPEVQEYVRIVISTVREQWGFDYLKLDFMYAASLPGDRYDKSMTRAEVLRMGNELIRKTAGKKAVLLGCGMPISAAVGTMDAMRVSCDVSPRWGVNPVEKLLHTDSNLETRGAIRNSIVRSFMDKRLWINDPDCLMLRTVRTHLNEKERRSLYNAVMTIGGMVVTSDDMSLYGDGEVKTLKSALALFEKTRKGKVCAPDILENKIPEMLYNDIGYLSIFNFSDRPAEKTLSSDSLSRYGISGRKLIDCDSGEAYDIASGQHFVLGAHDSRMFQVKK
ncbi:MAG: glycoside hydrolase family 36 protein, partial [Spirochaetota bacterium]